MKQAGRAPGLFFLCEHGEEKIHVSVATNSGALRSLNMKKMLHLFKCRIMGQPRDSMADEQTALPVETVTRYRGDLALGRDRSQHRRFTAHFEDLQN